MFPRRAGTEANQPVTFKECEPGESLLSSSQVEESLGDHSMIQPELKVRLRPNGFKVMYSGRSMMKVGLSFIPAQCLSTLWGSCIWGTFVTLRSTTYWPVITYERVQCSDAYGLVCFGLPAENAAMQSGVSPSEWTRLNKAAMKSQIKNAPTRSGHFY